MNDRGLLLRAGLRTDFVCFFEKCFLTIEPGTIYQDNWHIHAVAHALQRVWAGELKRLVINVPPRSGKSIITSIAYAAWVLGHDPARRIICVSHSDVLAKTHASAFRAIVGSPWSRELFPNFEIRHGGDREMETITTLHGYRYAVSMAGSVMGRGADLIIGDDPMSSAFALSEAVRKTEVNLWMTAHRTRLNNKREGAIVLVMQRLHQNDLVGHVLGSEDWEVLSIPAIATDPAAYRIGPDSEDVYNRQLNEVLHPEREPLDVLEATRRAIGSLTFSAQYQQDPVPPGGDVIRRDWLRFYDEAPAEFERLIVSWDTASTLSETSDWSVGTVWGAIGDEFYLLDVVRERLETPELRRTILRISEQWEADATLIEDTELGRALAQDLRASRRLRPLLERPRFDKQARLLAQAARFEAGQVLLPREAPWLGVYVGEILAFPTGSHDDQVDSTSQALRWLTARQAHPVDRPTREVERRDIRRVNFVTRRTRRDER